MALDGSTGRVQFQKDLYILDGVTVKIGTGDDLTNKT